MCKKVFLILMGLPGSGKGTCAGYIRDNFSYPVISVGDLLREESSKDSENGVLIRRTIERGELVDINIMIRLIHERVVKYSHYDKILFDGFPRNLEQAIVLRDIIGSNIKVKFTVIYLDVPNQLIVDRLANRLICRDCNYIYNKKSYIPNVCVSCGKSDSIIARNDDISQEVIVRRIDIASKNIDILLDFYKKNLINVCIIDGSQDVEGVNADIAFFLKN